MNARPEYMDVDASDPVDFPGRTPLQIARSELASFKFSTFETVRADPRLSAPCLAVMSVYLDFVTLNERTLKPNPAYASSIILMARAGIKSKTTVHAARRLLVKNGYLVRIGRTKNGCDNFRIENPNFERVRMHVREAEEYLKQKDAERSESERLKKRYSPRRGPNIDPTPNATGNRNWPDDGSNLDPNYHGVNLGEESFGEEETRKDSTTRFYSEVGDDPNVPYPVPQTEAELINNLDQLFGGWQLSPAIMMAMSKMLSAGTLTPAIVEDQRGFAL